MAQEIKMPNLGSDMEEGILLNWTKQIGEQINEGDVIAEIETDKATVEVPATASGTLIKLIGEPGETLKVGSVIGYVGAQGESAPANGRSAPEAKPAPKEPVQVAPTPAPTPAVIHAEGERLKASPVARKVAADRGIDLQQVPGSGPGGRIVKADVEGFQPQAAPVGIPTTAAPTIGTIPSGADVEVIDIPKMRARIGSRMVESKQQVPHFYVTVEIDVEALLALRQQINAGLDDAHKITVNDLIVKAAALTLRDFPNLNTHFYGDKLVHNLRINIGMAVPTNNGGLMNVVAKDADKVSLGTMAAQNKEMIARAREGKVKTEDISGSTFTVSNLGPYGVEHFLAIINPPEAGILAVGTAMKVPVVKPDGTLGVGNRMKVTISVDHRVSDGAEGARYLQRFKQLIENPMQLLI